MENGEDVNASSWKEFIVTKLQHNQHRYQFLVNIISLQQKVCKERDELRDKCHDLTIINRMQQEEIPKGGRQRSSTVAFSRRNSESTGNLMYEKKYKESERKLLELEENHQNLKEKLLHMYQERDELNSSERKALSEAKEANAKVAQLEETLKQYATEIEVLKGIIQEQKKDIELQKMQFHAVNEEMTAINLQFLSAVEKKNMLTKQNEEMLETILRSKEELAILHNEKVIDAQKAREDKIRRDLSEATGRMPDVTSVMKRSNVYKSYIPSKAVHTMDAHPSGGRVVAFDVGGSKFATGGVDHTIKLWSPNGHSIDSLNGHTATITSLDFSNGEDMLLSTSNDKSINLWDLNTKKSKFCFTSHTDKVYSARFLSNAKLVSASQDRSIVVWNAVRGASERTFLQNSTCFDIVALEGTRFISCHYDKHIREWDTRQKGSKPARELKTNHSQVIAHIVPSPDRRSILTCSKDNTLELIDLGMLSTETIFSDESMSIGHQACRPSFSTNGYNFVVGGSDGALRIWDVNSTKIVKTLSRACHDSAVTSTAWMGSQIVSTGLDGKVIVWEDEN
eukprot:m.128746 g.128746  ORF g.128746 m.128746 type:complete len:567 (-) comp9455_c0_seq6:191-1891(-)